MADPSHARYAVIIDAGSSGTRMYGYEWNSWPGQVATSGDSWRVDGALYTHLDEAIVIHQTFKKTSQAPFDRGIHEIQPDEVPAYFDSLVKQQFQENNPERAKYTLIVMATGGMREHRATNPNLFKDIDDAIQHYVDSDNGFNPEGKKYKTITGKEEGLYGWIATNYLLMAFPKAGIPEGTVDYLEMGGQTVQIAFRSLARVAETVLAAKDAKDRAILARDRLPHDNLAFDGLRRAVEDATALTTHADAAQAAHTANNNNKEYKSALMRVRLWGDQFDLYLRTYNLGGDAALKRDRAQLELQYPPTRIIYDPSKSRGWEGQTTDGRNIQGRFYHSKCEDNLRWLVGDLASGDVLPTPRYLTDPLDKAENLLANAPPPVVGSFFVGGASFYYSMRSSFGRDRWGKPRDVPHKMSDFNKEILSRGETPWSLVKKYATWNDPKPVEDIHLANSVFMATWINIILREAFQLGIDEEPQADLRFQPYNGPNLEKKDTRPELSWTLGVIFIEACQELRMPGEHVLQVIRPSTVGPPVRFQSGELFQTNGALSTPADAKAQGHLPDTDPADEWTAE